MYQPGGLFILGGLNLPPCWLPHPAFTLLLIPKAFFVPPPLSASKLVVCILGGLIRGSKAGFAVRVLELIDLSGCGLLEKDVSEAVGTGRVGELERNMYSFRL